MDERDIIPHEIALRELEHIQTQQWMTTLSVCLHELPISKLAIPGTHNSGTYFLSTSLAPDLDGCIARLARNAVIGPSVRKIIHKWAQCQTLNITEQLEAGIRYFDLRVAASSSSEDFFLVHAFLGIKLSEFLFDLSIFLYKHPYEVVLLDFNHFYGMETKHEQLINYLLSNIGSICNQCDISDLTLYNMWSHQNQVIIFYQNEAALGHKELWPESRILSHWPNTDNPIVCRDFLHSCFSKCPARDFTVCQWVLTPNTTTIMKGLLKGGNVETLSDTLLPLMWQWVKETSHSCVHPPTIITADHVVDGDHLIQSIIKLNYKRTASE